MHRALFYIGKGLRKAVPSHSTAEFAMINAPFSKRGMRHYMWLQLHVSSDGKNYPFGGSVIRGGTWHVWETLEGVCELWGPKLTCDALVNGEQEQIKAVAVPRVEERQDVRENCRVLAACMWEATIGKCIPKTSAPASSMAMDGPYVHPDKAEEAQK